MMLLYWNKEDLPVNFYCTCSNPYECRHGCKEELERRAKNIRMEKIKKEMDRAMFEREFLTTKPRTVFILNKEKLVKVLPYERNKKMDEEKLSMKNNCASPHPTELKLPQQTEAFRDIIHKMYQTHLDKNADYSPANITVAGEIGVLVRIWDKFCRLCNLHGIEFPAIGPQLQTLIDSIQQEKSLDSEQKDLTGLINKLNEIKKKSEFDFSNVKPKSPKNESIEDAWLDLSVYSIIGLLQKSGKWGR